jgi:hypothetical protein
MPSVVGFLDAQRDVALQFAVEPLADLAAGDELAFAAGQRRGVDQKFIVSVGSST